MNKKNIKQQKCFDSVGAETIIVDTDIDSLLLAQREAYASNVNTDKEILSVLLHDKEHSVVLRAVKNKNTDLLDLYELFQSDNLNKETKDTIKRYIRIRNKGKVFDEEFAIATHSSNVADLIRIAFCSDKYLRGAVARNPLCPEGILKMLFNDIIYVKSRLAANTSAPESMLIQLYELIIKPPHSKLMILESLASNFNTPRYILINFSTHSNIHVRIALAKNTGSPHEVRKKLSTDESREVRFTLAYTSYLYTCDCNKEIINTLLDDADSHVQGIAEFMKKMQDKKTVQ